MKTPRRLKLPAIGDGTLIADRAGTEHDFYDSLSIEHESSDFSSSSDSLTDESSPSPSFRPSLLRRGRFTSLKAVTNAIIAQRCWAKTVIDKWKNELHGAANIQEKEDPKSMTFNPKAFKAHIQACGKLTPEMKVILRKYSGDRTAAEVEVGARLIRRLRCFDRYSPSVKEELGRIVYYDHFEDGRLVIRQGQLGISFYFIVSGRVVVERIEVDKQTGSRHIQRVDELGPGYSFGELALLHSNTKRAASMICKGSCEFLRIDRGEFEDALQTIREKEWDLRANILNELKVFSGYSTRDLVVLNTNAKSETFWPNTVILGGSALRSDRVYIIISGTCNVVKQLLVIKRQLKDKKYKYFLPSEEMLKQLKLSDGDTGNPNDTLEKHNLVISQLGSGDIFNLGEKLRDVMYITCRKVSVIHISKMAIAKAETGKGFEKIKEKFAIRMPPREDIFNDFVAELKWKNFKRKMVQDVIGRNKHHHRINWRKIPLYLKNSESSYLCDQDIV